MIVFGDAKSDVHAVNDHFDRKLSSLSAMLLICDRPLDAIPDIVSLGDNVPGDWILVELGSLSSPYVNRLWLCARIDYEIEFELAIGDPVSRIDSGIGVREPDRTIAGKQHRCRGSGA